ncbi:hypothetical protein [Altererythrobacter sp. MTPC7]|uniref:hypothetical protein n=1 Tax=Altererythrobacter sp. MTPC7 TaxID=3056567 RepID=UPI0036F2D32B
MTVRSAFIAAGATLSMAATPVAAAELPVSTQRSAVAPAAAYDADAENAQRHRYRGYRGYNGYRGYRGYRNRTSAGDIIAGVAILGTIAAVASAASKNRDRDRYPDRRYRTSGPSYDTSSGLDRAVDQCVLEIERDVRIGEIDGVDRNGSGWNVTGTLYNGDGFSCRIGNDGRIDGIDYGTRGGFTGAGYDSALRTGAAADGQWDDAVYARARTSAGYAEPDLSGPADDALPAGVQQGPQPAYPGGPVADEYQYADEGNYGG